MNINYLFFFTFVPYILIFFLWRCGPRRALASSFFRFLDYTQRRITAGRTPLDEWSARRRDLYLTTHNTHNRQTSMPPVGFEPTISAGERPQNYALDCAATGPTTSWYYRSFIYLPIDALVSCLKKNIKIYIKTSPTCFGVTVTPSSGSALICAY